MFGSSFFLAHRSEYLLLVVARNSAECEWRGTWTNHSRALCPVSTNHSSPRAASSSAPQHLPPCQPVAVCNHRLDKIRYNFRYAIEIEEKAKKILGTLPPFSVPVLVARTAHMSWSWRQAATHSSSVMSPSLLRSTCENRASALSTPRLGESTFK